MFWALAQRQKDIEKGRQQVREEGFKKGREEAWEKLIQLLAEQNVSLSPEALAEIKDRSKEPPRN